MGGAFARHPDNRRRPVEHKASGDRLAAAGRVTYSTTLLAKLDITASSWVAVKAYRDKGQTIRREREGEERYEFGSRPDHHVSPTQTCRTVRLLPPDASSTTSPGSAVLWSGPFLRWRLAPPPSHSYMRPTHDMQAAGWSRSTRRVGRANTPNKSVAYACRFARDPAWSRTSSRASRLAIDLDFYHG